MQARGGSNGREEAGEVGCVRGRVVDGGEEHVPAGACNEAHVMRRMLFRCCGMLDTTRLDAADAALWKGLLKGTARTGS